MDLELSLQPDADRYTWGCLLEDVAERHAGRVAIRFEGRDLHYEELEAQSRELARALIGAGVGKGARVALLMANRPEWAVAAFAAGLVGAVLVPVNTFATPDELDYILRHSDASLLLMQPQMLKQQFARDLAARHPALSSGTPGRLHCPALPQLRRVVCLGAQACGFQSSDELLALGSDVDDRLQREVAADVHPSDDGLIIYTSGTTAHPKGVLHAQRAGVIQSWRFAQDMGLTPEDRVWTAQPFFWTAGMAMSLGATLAAGACLLLEEHFDAASALDLMEREGATTAHAWPHQEKALAEHPSAASRDLSRLWRVEFDSPLAEVLGLEKDVWGMHGSYGLSETFTLSSLLPASAPAELRQRTSGRALPGMQLRIVDPETGAPLGPGEPGEIAVRGVTFMRGYYKQEPEQYLDENGFFRTQDGGWIDEAGHLHWSGRLSNLIKTGGANVSPLEIERQLQTYPGVQVAAAVGVPHPTLGEAIVLCAAPSPGARLEPEAIRSWLRERISAFKVPRCVLLFDPSELEFTGNQKLQTGPLREAALARLEAEQVTIEGHAYGGS
jgi:acyl-CoA synthetase (AMP-forming)/AMP-acid ligase II